MPIVVLAVGELEPILKRKAAMFVVVDSSSPGIVTGKAYK